MSIVIDKDMIQLVGNMFKKTVYLHCDKCDHEQAECLGLKCSWCGGNMIPIKQKET